MIALIGRLVMGVIGLMGAALFTLAWFDLPRFAALLGPTAPTALAQATLRADAGGFFGVWAIGALLAALRNDRRYTTMPLLLLTLAAAGRGYTYWLTHDMAIIQPLAVEGALVVIIALARQALDESYD